MKYVVAFKWAPDPQDAIVAADGTIDWGKKRALSEYDPVAFRVARELADETGAEVVGVTVGPAESASTKATQAAAARGADSLIIVADDSLVDASPTRIAQIFAETVKNLGDVSLVLTGDSSVDGGSKTFPGLVAAFLDGVTLAEVTEVAADGDGFKVTREWEGGTQTMSVTAPAVLAIATDATKVPVPGMKDLMAAKKKPVETVDASGFAPDATGSTVTVTSTRKPAAKARKNQIFEGADAADQLVAALRNDGIL